MIKFEESQRRPGIKALCERIARANPNWSKGRVEEAAKREWVQKKTS